MDELQAAALHRLARAPAATHISQRAGTAYDPNWPHSADAAWDRAHPEARIDRGPTPIAFFIPALWPALAAGFWLGALNRTGRGR